VGTLKGGRVVSRKEGGGKTSWKVAWFLNYFGKIRRRRLEILGEKGGR